jgi:hypothetical protein
MGSERQDLLDDAKRLQRLLSALYQWRHDVQRIPQSPMGDTHADGLRDAERQISGILIRTATGPIA